jgi:hypothetical protein
MGRLSWLRPGHDHELAATRYAGRESASDAKARKEEARSRPKPEKQATAIRNGQRWEAADRRRFGS